MNEVARIKEAYARRYAAGKKALYNDFNEASLYIHQRRDSELLSLFKRSGIDDLSCRAVLEVGCGNGAVLRKLLSWGADPALCRGVDLLPDRIEEARRLSPNMDFICSNAETLPYADDSFDVVVSFTVFSSILDPSMRKNLAAEMLRVLKKGGIIIWYDYHMNNPRNPDVRGMKHGEIVSLFHGCEFDLKRITLAPPLARRVAPFSFMACDILEKLFFLRTHYLGAIRKK